MTLTGIASTIFQPFSAFGPIFTRPTYSFVDARSGTVLLDRTAGVGTAVDPRAGTLIGATVPPAWGVVDPRAGTVISS